MHCFALLQHTFFWDHNDVKCEDLLYYRLHTFVIALFFHFQRISAGFFYILFNYLFTFSGLPIIPSIRIAMPKCLKSTETIALEFLPREIYNQETNYFLIIDMDQQNNLDLQASNEKWNSCKVFTLILLFNQDGIRFFFLPKFF